MLRTTRSCSDFQIEPRWAVTRDDLLRHVQDLHPTIVLIAGGGASGGLTLRNEQGAFASVPAPVLAAVLRRVGGIKLVVLDACYSATYGHVLGSVASCVLGTPAAIGDREAHDFAIDLYRAFGIFRSITHSIEYATHAIRRLPSDASLPVRWARQSVGEPGRD